MTGQERHVKFWGIEDAGGLVRIDRHNLPDLDALMLEVLMHPDVREHTTEQWEDQLFGDGEDVATKIPYTDSWYQEAEVKYFRTNPCTCGEGHTFDLASVAMDEEGNPTGKGARGAFMGVYFR